MLLERALVKKGGIDTPTTSKDPPCFHSLLVGLLVSWPGRLSWFVLVGELFP